jgi:rhamnose transport system substrate-binding protein
VVNSLIPRRIAVLSAGIALAVGLTACGGTTRDAGTGGGAGGGAAATTANPGATVKEGLSFALLPKQVNNPYFDTASKGAEKAAQAVKGTYKYTGPSDATASSQVSYINTLSQQGTQVILLSANDPNALCPALRQARSAGAKVVTFDSDVDPGCRDAMVSQVDSTEVAKVQVEMLGEQINYEGEIAILSATPNATNQNAWIKVMEQELATPKYSKMKLVKIAYGNDEDQKSFQETQGLLQSYPNLKGIISPTTVGIAAAARYLSGSQYKGKVALTGLGTPNQMRAFVKDGTVKVFALWDPAKLGELAVHAGAAVASGIITGAQGQKFKAGDLGEYTVGPNGVIILGPPQKFDASNIDQFNF